jgi:hypothetical protein
MKPRCVAADPRMKGIATGSICPGAGSPGARNHLGEHESARVVSEKGEPGLRHVGDDEIEIATVVEIAELHPGRVRGGRNLLRGGESPVARVVKREELIRPARNDDVEVVVVVEVEEHGRVRHGRSF